VQVNEVKIIVCCVTNDEGRTLQSCDAAYWVVQESIVQCVQC